jgi:nucleoside-diphosphate-sugar epimerase
MSRILIAGCGYVGEAAANLFHGRGWQVEGWTASAASAGELAGLPFAVRAVDLADRAAVSANSQDFDVILQCASSRGGDAEEYRRLYLEGARNLIAAFPTAALVFTSSTSVYAQKDGTVVDESSPAEPIHDKGKILREAEELVLSNRGIVARLGGIYGPGRSFFLSKFLSGTAVVDPNDRFINQIHRDDIVSALLLLAERRAECRGEIYNLVDDHPITPREAYAWLSSELKKGAESFPSATWERGSGKPSPTEGNPATPRKRGESNKRVSNQKLRALGWQPQFPSFSVAMTKSILPSLGI